MIGRTNPHARTLRVNSTDAEVRLWSHLRKRQLAGLKFRRQDTLGPTIVDFLSPELKLIIEADDGQHSEDTDRAGTAFLQAHGYTMLRFWNDDILRNIDGVLTMVLDAPRKAEPSPSPLPQAGEGH
jgi:very-short-patch-repair endonuclease